MGKTNTVRITDYESIFIPCFTEKGELRIAIRSYDCNDEPYFLAVNPYTFATTAAPVTSFVSRRSVPSKPGYYTKEEIDSTPYVKALNQFTSPPYQLQNYGLTHATHPVNGAFLTIDMCPSVKPFEAEFFQKLANYSDKEATPIALSMTGLWLLRHPDEFNWLVQQTKENKLAITWVNHSYSHIYYADLVSQTDLAKNFLLAERTNLKHELLTVEKLLLKHSQLPSVFFRTPGLVANEKLVKKFNKLGLIDVGSDAWLAKGEEPKDGSIILVHGNSNEHAGIEKIMPMLEQRKFTFFPLSKAVDSKQGSEEPSLTTKQSL